MIHKPSATSATPHARGLTTDALAAEVVTVWTRSTPQTAPTLAEQDTEQRRTAAYEALGCLEGKGMSVDEFLAERHAVAQAEAEKDAQRMAR